MTNMLVKKHLEKLNEYRQNKDYINAFMTIESILFIDKENKEALFRQAQCSIELKRYQVAFKRFSKLVNDEVFGYKSVLYMKWCLNKIDIVNIALPMFIELINKYPDNRNLHLYYGDSLYEIEKYSEAITQYKRAIEFGEKESFINEKIAECWFKKGNFKKAIEYIDCAIFNYTSCLTFSLAELHYKKAKYCQYLDDSENAYMNAKLALYYIDNFQVWSDLEYNDIFDIIVSKGNKLTHSTT